MSLFNLFFKGTKKYRSDENITKRIQDTEADVILRNRVLDMSEQVTKMYQQQQQSHEKIKEYENSTSTYKLQISSLQEELDIYKEKVKPKEDYRAQNSNEFKKSSIESLSQTLKKVMHEKIISNEEEYKAKLLEAKKTVQKIAQKLDDVEEYQQISKKKAGLQLETLVKKNEQLTLLLEQSLEKNCFLDEQLKKTENTANEQQLQLGGMQKQVVSIKEKFEKKLIEAEIKLNQSLQKLEDLQKSEQISKVEGLLKLETLEKKYNQMVKQNGQSLEKITLLEKELKNVKIQYEQQLGKMQEENKTLNEKLYNTTIKNVEQIAETSIPIMTSRVEVSKEKINEKTSSLKAFIKEIEERRSKSLKEDEYIDIADDIDVPSSTFIDEKVTSSEHLPKEIVNSFHNVVDSFYNEVERKQHKTQEQPILVNNFFDREDKFEHDYIDKTVKDIKIRIPKKLPSRYQVADYFEVGWHQPSVEQVHQLHTQADILKEQANQPYFGRMDLYSNNTGTTYYIGKKSLGDHIISWQTDAASIYYEKNIGNISNHSTLGEIKLDYLRQIDIEDGKVIRLHPPLENQDSTDYSLKHTLSSKRGQDMQTIVATIQKEQNELIRLPIHNSIIIQGSAGSGKSVIALHRLSYLLYKYKTLKENAVAIFGPNKLFLDHIRKVLPDLGNYKIIQSTFQDFTAGLLDTKKETFPRYMEDDRILVVSLKGSLNYKNYIGYYAEQVLNNLKPWIRPFIYTDEYIEIRIDALEMALYYEQLNNSYYERSNKIINWLTHQVNDKIQLLKEMEDQKEEFVKQFSDAWISEILNLPNELEYTSLLGQALTEEISSFQLELLYFKNLNESNSGMDSNSDRIRKNQEKRKSRIQAAIHQVVIEQINNFSTIVDGFLEKELDIWLQPLLDLWWIDKVENEIEKLTNMYLLSTLDLDLTVITSIRSELDKPEILAEKEQMQALFQEQFKNKRDTLEEKLKIEMKENVKDLILYQGEKAWRENIIEHVGKIWGLDIDIPLNSTKPSFKQYPISATRVHEEIKDFATPHFNLTATDLLSNILKDEFRIQQKINTEKNLNIDMSLLQNSYDKTKKRGKLSWLCYEDMPALQHITIIMKGKSYVPPLSYLILDEAQDYMPYEIYIMSKMTSSNGLMLIGDLGQNLNEANNIVNWNEFNTLLNTPSYFELQATYRSTSQIVEISNEIIRPFSSGKYTLSEQTYREGSEVKWIPTNKSNLYKHITQLLKDIESRTENYEAIAIIVKTREEGIELQQNLLLDQKIELQTEDQAVKSKIIITTPIASKGLEFDCVIIADLSQYDSSDYDRKLAYVATSRSLHELHIFHTNSIKHLIK